MNGKTNRRSGHSFEREIANDLKEIFPGARRRLEYHKEDGGQGIDLINTGKYKIQCKNRKTYTSVNTINEVKCDFDEVPILITRAKRQGTMAVLPWKDLLNLLETTEKQK